MLLISEDLDEVMLMSDRIGVMSRGRIVREFDAPAEQLAAIKARRYPSSNTGLATLNYRTKFAGHYQARGETPPSGTVGIGHIQAGNQAWTSLNDHQRRCMLTGYGMVANAR